MLLPLFEHLKIKIEGTSHSKEILLEIEGLPRDEKIYLQELQEFVDRRKSRDVFFSTPRKEADKIEVLQGLSGGKADGGKFVAIVENTDVKQADYGKFKATPRPGHADYAALLKCTVDFAGGKCEDCEAFPTHNEKADLGGGGQFSGRMTLPLVIAGGIATQILKRRYGTEALGYVSEIAGIKSVSYLNGDIPLSALRQDTFADSAEKIKQAQKKNIPVLGDDKAILAKLKEIAEDGDSAGGVVECIVFKPPLGAGGSFTEGLESRLSALLFSIPSVKGVEFGSGFELAGMTGSQSNDRFRFVSGKVVTETNHNGGINGGISNGMPITMRVALKPVPSIAKEQKTVNLVTRENDTVKIEGRHDVCVVSRAVVCVEAMVALALLDCILVNYK